MGDIPGGDPRVSILRPVYQAERRLEEAVESLLAQSCDDFELLALDDGSSDASPQILSTLATRGVVALGSKNRTELLFGWRIPILFTAMPHS